MSNPSPELLHDSPNGLLRCRCTVEDDCTVLYVSGEIDIATCDALAFAIAPHCNGPLTLDFAEVAFLGAAGVHVLREPSASCIDRDTL